MSIRRHTIPFPSLSFLSFTICSRFLFFFVCLVLFYIHIYSFVLNFFVIRCFFPVILSLSSLYFSLCNAFFLSFFHIHLFPFFIVLLPFSLLFFFHRETLFPLFINFLSSFPSSLTLRKKTPEWRHFSFPIRRQTFSLILALFLYFSFPFLSISLTLPGKKGSKRWKVCAHSSPSRDKEH